MNDKSDLLGQLKIDRGSAAPPRTPWPWIAAAAVVVLALAAWLIMKPASALPVKTALARTLTANGDNASVLDATGYVVAQREATVSSKVTGRVQALLIEEGQHVKQG
ncbi:MAG: biotin/lipoyl-binding protein, partial [Stenotrophobium sp.]